jgi:hypothetical protein
VTGRGSHRPRTRLKKILIFGEDQNDTTAIAHLLNGLLGQRTISVEPRRRPPVLIRDATTEQLASRVLPVVRLVKAAEADAEVVALIVHEDCDAMEPAHDELARKIEAALAHTGVVVIAATPAWETESWLMQWPQAFSEYRPAWRSIEKYNGRRVGLIRNAKEDLRRSLRPNNAGTIRDYRESDAPLLAEIVSIKGWADSPLARSDSYDAFREKIHHSFTV